MEELIAECRRVLRRGLPETVPVALEDEQDVIPLGLDVQDDAAAVAMLRWWAGPPEHPGPSPALPRPLVDVWTFHRHDGEWIELGGGGCMISEYPLSSRRPAVSIGGHLRCYCRGRKSADRLFPRGGRHVSHALLRVSAEVDHVRVGSRVLTAPFHGNIVVVWATSEAPVIDALRADGAILSDLDLGEDQRPG